MVQTLAFALRHGRRAARPEQDELVARLVAEHLAEHLERSNLVVMQKPPATAPTAPYRGNPNLTE